MKKCQIWVCSHTGINPYVAESICKTVQQEPAEWDFKTKWNDALISRSRNIAATQFLATDYEVLMFIDDDIYFEPFQAKELVRKCHFGYDIIGGFYPTKPTPYLASRLPKGTRCKLPSPPDTPPVKAEFVSTGFIAIHRKVLEKMTCGMKMAYADRVKYPNAEPYYPLFEPFSYKGEWLSEDWAFIQRARNAGFESYLAPDIFLGHFGTYCYTMRDRLRPVVNDNVILDFEAG